MTPKSIWIIAGIVIGLGVLGYLTLSLLAQLTH